jgi:hypothetical protein
MSIETIVTPTDAPALEDVAEALTHVIWRRFAARLSAVQQLVEFVKQQYE